MNNRSLTRGDAVVIGAAVLLFIASFLPFYSFDGANDSRNGWSNFFYPLLPSVFLLGVIGAGLIVGSRFVGAALQGKELAGLRMDQWGIGFTVASLWSAFWMLFANPLGIKESLSTGAGMILALLATAVLVAGAIATKLVPALQAPLISNTPKPAAQQQPYGQQPQAGYGYPGPQPGQPQPQPQYGQQPPQQGMQPHDQQPQPQQAQPAAAPAPGATPAADPNFQPFWFAVPVQRPLYPEDGSPTPIAELAPGTWYLAVEQRGPALVAQTQDGRRGVLQDTSGIQRG